MNNNVLNKIDILIEEASQFNKALPNTADIRNFVLSYYKTNDPAHQIGHADEVYQTAMEMNNKLHLWKNKEDIALAVYLHDIFSDQRKTHHQLAHDFIMKSTDKIFDGVDLKRRQLIARAVLEHRASYEGEYGSKLSELVASADRGKPDLQKNIDRSTKYHNGNRDMAIKHVKEKFGRSGYAKYPKIYEDFYAQELEKRYREIDKMI